MSNCAFAAHDARLADDEAPPVFDPWNTLQPVRFPIRALPNRLRTFVENRSQIIGADPAAIAWAALSACSAAIDGRIRLRMKRHDSWTVPPAVWVALIGQPSTKKSPAIDVAWAPLHRVQKRDIDTYQAELKKWKAIAKEDRPDEPDPPRRLVSHDATMEAMQDILSKQDRGIGVLRDELAGWIGSMEKYAPGKGGAADRAFWLQSFNGGSHVVDRVARGMVASANVLTTICGGIQPDRLRQFSDITDDGLWQRFIPIILAPATIGEDAPVAGSTGYDDLIDQLLNVQPETALRLSDDAHNVREDVQRRIFDMEQAEVLGPRFIGFIGKLVGLWGRLTLVLHLINDPTSEFVSGATADAARTLIFVSVLPNAARVYAAMGGSGANVEATQSIAGYILTKKITRLVMSDLTSNVRVCRHQTADDVRKILSPLEAGGWIEPETEIQPKAWIVSDRVHTQFSDRAEREKERRANIRAIITGEAVS